MIEALQEHLDEGALQMDRYEDCVIGVVMRANQSSILCYDIDKVLERHVKDGMSHEEAVEFFEFNQLGAWMEDGTPCFIQLAEMPGPEALE